jgi:lysophospholipase L1-like esterase
MFSLDRFHPSTHGYKRTAAAMLPSVLAALGHADAVPFGHHAPDRVQG